MGCPETACSCFLPVAPICPSRLLNLQKGGHPLYVRSMYSYLHHKKVPRWAVTYHQRRCSVWSWSSLRGITKGGNKIRAAKNGKTVQEQKLAVSSHLAIPRRKGSSPHMSTCSVSQLHGDESCPVYEVLRPYPILVLLSANSRSTCFPRPVLLLPSRSQTTLSRG